jgi:methyltransferase (TIGR00027 family)
MQANRSSRTAEFMALFRALETRSRPRQQRLFDDPLAVDFLSPSLRVAVELCRVPAVERATCKLVDSISPGARSSGVARTRLIDDALLAALSSGIKQLVILGAGFDSRAYRLRELQKLPVFEVDHPATSEQKQRLLQRRYGRLPEHVSYVPIDFAVGDLRAALDEAGLANVPTFYIWEGVTNYLDADAVDAMLRYIASAPLGSRLAFTYVHRGVLDGSIAFAGVQHLGRVLRQTGEPWTFGLDPAEVPAFLAARGLRLLEDLGADDYRRRYWGEHAAELEGYAFYRAVFAEVTGAA